MEPIIITSLSHGPEFDFWRFFGQINDWAMSEGLRLYSFQGNSFQSDTLYYKAFENNSTLAGWVIFYCDSWQYSITIKNFDRDFAAFKNQFPQRKKEQLYFQWGEDPMNVLRMSWDNRWSVSRCIDHIQDNMDRFCLHDRLLGLLSDAIADSNKDVIKSLKNQRELEKGSVRANSSIEKKMAYATSLLRGEDRISPTDGSHENEWQFLIINTAHQSLKSFISKEKQKKKNLLATSPEPPEDIKARYYTQYREKVILQLETIRTLFEGSLNVKLENINLKYKAIIQESVSQFAETEGFIQQGIITRKGILEILIVNILIRLKN